MTTRTATCRCGQLRATATADPLRISVCHCLDCQKRSGSAFAAQARWPSEEVTADGTSKSWSPASTTDTIFHFCPDCGSTVYYTGGGTPGLTAIAIGAFADPNFPSPQFSVWEERKYRWVEIVGQGVEHQL